MKKAEHPVATSGNNWILCMWDLVGRALDSGKIWIFPTFFKKLV